MVNSLLKTLGLGCLFVSSLQAMAAQTEVLIKLWNSAEEQKYVVEEKGKLFFSNDRLFIDQVASNAPASFELSSIARVRFQPSLSSTESIFSDGGEAFIYPNPATDNFYFANLSEKVVVSIYSIDGALVLRQSYSPEEGISVSGISNGLYLVKVGNQTFKLEKK